MSEPTRHLKTGQVKERYGISKMTLHRWVTNDALGFPKPIKIQHRNYYRVEDLEAFDEKRQERSA